ncbi:hypothetical protein JCM10135_03130 [Stetteria hydrogenophila]
MDDGLVVEAGNSRITLLPREVDIDGLYYGLSEHFLDGRQERKGIYIHFAFPLRGKSGGTPPALMLSSTELGVGPFGVVYTVLDGVEYYLTVHPPPGFLYDYAVITTRCMFLKTLGRRQVYVMDEGRLKRIMLV